MGKEDGLGHVKEIKTPEFLDAASHVEIWTQMFIEKEMGVHKLDRNKLRTFFEAVGARLDINPSLKETLDSHHFGNEQTSQAMKEVWGEKKKVYKDWCETYVVDYESRTHKELPKIEFKTGKASKIEGMKGFLVELTAYAVSDEKNFGWDELINRLGARLYNGKLREQGIKETKHRKTVTIEGYNKDSEGKEKPFAPAGFPSEFPERAIAFVRSLRSFVVGFEK